MRTGADSVCKGNDGACSGCSWPKKNGGPMGPWFVGCRKGAWPCCPPMKLLVKCAAV